MTIYQGDQYAVPFVVRLGGELVTPAMGCEVRIQLAGELHSSAEDLAYNAESQVWELPLTEAVSRALAGGTAPYQVGVKIGDVIRYSPVARLTVGQSIIKAVWAGG